MKVKIEVELEIDYKVTEASRGRRENGFNIEPDTEAELEIVGAELNGECVLNALTPHQIEMVRTSVAEELMEEVGA